MNSVPFLHYCLVMSDRSSSLSAHLHMQKFLRRRLKLSQLRLLVSLDQFRHVGRAADALHVTQPAVSKALAELERGLGMPLFARTPQGLVPTQEGTCLIRYAQSVDENLNRTVSELSAIAQGSTWRLSVGAGHGTTPVVSKALECLQQRKEPDAAFDISIQESPVDLLLPLLRSGKLDILVGAVPDGLGAEIRVVPLYLDPIVWMVAQDHPLARKMRPDHNDLSNMIWVLPPRTARIRARIDSVLRRYKLSTSARLVETSSFDVLLSMVCDQGAAALLARKRVLSAEARGLVRMLNIKMENLVTPISAIMLDRQEPNGYLEEFIQCLVEVSL